MHFTATTVMESVANEVSIIIMAMLPFSSMLRLHRSSRKWASLPLKRCFRPRRLSLVPSKMLLYLLRNNLIPGGINPLTHWSKRRDLWIQQFDLNYIRKLNIWDYRDLAPNNVDRLRLQTLYLQDIYLDSVKEVIIDEEDEAIVKENDLSVFYWFLPFKFATVWRCANLNPTTVISYFYRNRPWRVKEIYFKYSSTWAKEGHLGDPLHTTMSSANKCGGISGIFA